MRSISYLEIGVVIDLGSICESGTVRWLLLCGNFGEEWEGSSLRDEMSCG